MDIECGTNNGYERHRRADEKACRSCSAAHSRHIQAWRVQSGRAERLMVDVGVLAAVVAGDIDVLRMALGTEMVTALSNLAALVECRRRRDAEALGAVAEVVERLDPPPDTAFDIDWSAIHYRDSDTFTY